jgi:2',3'-cyclic-nucleotide 2'-phosphodiesterase (5'-nucleotidase family)
LTLVHSQDSYGAVVAVDGANNPCAPVGLSYAGGEGLGGCLGGNARREAAIAQLRSNASTNLLVVDIGNVFSGNAGVSSSGPFCI